MFEIHEQPRGFFIFGEILFEKAEQISVRGEGEALFSLLLRILLTPVFARYIILKNKPTVGL